LALVGRWTSPNIPHARCTHCTRGVPAHPWGRVEKMLFRPIRKKQNSLSLNNIQLLTFNFSLLMTIRTWSMIDWPRPTAEVNQ
jgi:hypothetical protein